MSVRHFSIIRKTDVLRVMEESFTTLNEYPILPESIVVLYTLNTQNVSELLSLNNQFSFTINISSSSPNEQTLYVLWSYSSIHIKYLCANSSYTHTAYISISILIFLISSLHSSCPFYCCCYFLCQFVIQIKTEFLWKFFISYSFLFIIFFIHTLLWIKSFIITFHICSRSILLFIYIGFIQRIFIIFSSVEVFRWVFLKHFSIYIFWQLPNHPPRLRLHIKFI